MWNVISGYLNETVKQINHFDARWWNIWYRTKAGIIEAYLGHKMQAVTNWDANLDKIEKGLSHEWSL